MFERLDDPHPYAPDPAVRVRVQATARSRRRRRRGLVAGSALVALLAVVTAPILYLRQQAGQLEHVEVGGLVPVAPDTGPPTTVASEAPPAATTPSTAPPALAAAINVLVVGVDQRPPGDEVSGSRTDTIAVVRIDPYGPALTVLSIPRDLWVPIDGGKQNRINSALGVSREALVDTVSAVLDVPINHYMEIDFAGFSRLVDLAGGVEMQFDTPVRDRNTGLDVPEPGCVRLDGAQALAYVRSRHFQTYDATGTWTEDPTSDLGRIARQQDFGVRAIQQVLASSYSNLDQLRILTDVLDDVTVDEGLDLDGLRAIWATAADAQRAGKTTLLTLNDLVRGETVGEASVLVADEESVRDLAAPLRGDGPTVGPTTPSTAPRSSDIPASPTDSTLGASELSCG
jgi:LCP family protein required for cell wall assembly